MYLNAKLNFEEHVNNVLSKLNKTAGLLRKLQTFAAPIFGFGI